MTCQSRKTKGDSLFAGRAAAVLALLTGLWVPPTVGQVCSYEVVATITGPECSPGSFAFFSAWAMDEQGNAAGSVSCNVTPTAAVWSGQGVAAALSGPPNVSQSIAFAMTDPDHIVGRARPNGSTLDIAAHWENGVGTLLPLLPGANTSEAHGINSSLHVVGFTHNSVVGPSQAFVWQDNAIAALDLPLGPDARAFDINELSQITGWMGSVFTSNAFVYDQGETTIIPFIPGGQSSSGAAINARGHVAGLGLIDVHDVGLTRHAFYWDGEQGFDLGVLPDHKRSRALDINDLDQIVGESLSTVERAAFFWQNGAMYNLQDLVIDDLGTASVNAAAAINNQGWILAGTTTGDIIVLTPIGTGPGDIDHNCIVNVNDLLLLIGEWGQSNSFADVNEDGIVNVIDLLDLLGDWG